MKKFIGIMFLIGIVATGAYFVFNPESLDQTMQFVQNFIEGLQDQYGDDF